MYVFVCICMYWACIFDLFWMYFVCIVYILQNVSVSMRLATFVAKNTSKYIQYRQIHTSYIHQFYTNTYKNTYKYIQNKSATKCIYVYLCACICMYMPMCIYVYVLLCYYVYLCACISCICLYYVCMTVFYASKDKIWRACCMCMYLHVSVCISWLPLFTRGYMCAVGPH